MMNDSRSALADQSVSFAALDPVPPKPCNMMTRGVGVDLSQDAGTCITHCRSPWAVVTVIRTWSGGSSSIDAPRVRAQKKVTAKKAKNPANTIERDFMAKLTSCLSSSSPFTPSEPKAGRNPAFRHFLACTMRGQVLSIR
jgi:hypothetical protein